MADGNAVNEDAAVVDALVEQARVRLERAVAAGAGKAAQAALQALTAPVAVEDADKTPTPPKSKGK